MPQDIPLEASETLAFTPESLSSLDSPPVFTLRATSPRDKRWMRRLIVEEGAVRHGEEECRAEMLSALQLLWGAEAFAEHAPQLEEYWNAIDAYQVEKKADPEAKWHYDADIEKGILLLEDEVAKAHRPFARMRADNAQANEVSMLAMVAVAVIRWSGLDITPERERGYLTVDGISELRDALTGMGDGRAWAELVIACTRRMFIGEEEEKNSASPSPSGNPPVSSAAVSTDQMDGTSPVSEPSTETLATE